MTEVHITNWGDNSDFEVKVERQYAIGLGPILT